MEPAPPGPSRSAVRAAPNSTTLRRAPWQGPLAQLWLVLFIPLSADGAKLCKKVLFCFPFYPPSKGRPGSSPGQGCFLRASAGWVPEGGRMLGAGLPLS